MKVDSITLTPKGAHGERRTDSAIQRKDFSLLVDRELVSASSWLDEASTSTDLESTPSTGNWNQFEVNSRLFNVKNTFDENLYTTKLDVSKLTKEQIEKTERIAKEIETTKFPERY